MSDAARENLILPAAGPSADCPPEKNLAPKWFAVYTAPRHEKRVGQYLGVKQIEHYVPLYQARRKWSDGTTVILDLPLFPGYVFVRIDRSQRVRVLQVPGVVSFVGGTGRRPPPCRSRKSTPCAPAFPCATPSRTPCSPQASMFGFAPAHWPEWLA